MGSIQLATTFFCLATMGSIRPAADVMAPQYALSLRAPFFRSLVRNEPLLCPDSLGNELEEYIEYAAFRHLFAALV